MEYLTAADQGVLLAVHVQPRASRNMICGVHDGSLKIAVTTPPVDGKANKAVAAFLAKTLGMAKRDVHLRSGQTSRRKVFFISDISVEELRGYIESILKK